MIWSRYDLSLQSPLDQMALCRRHVPGTVSRAVSSAYKSYNNNNNIYLYSLK